jgi:hypothetical protein
LPNVERLAGTTPSGSAAEVARRAWGLGLRGTPVLTGTTAWTDSIAAGAMQGHKRDGVLLASTGHELASWVENWLAGREPNRLTVVRNRLAPVAACQAEIGAMRSWYCAERELARQGYHMPQIDGRRDSYSVWAIYAFEKVAGRSPNGSFGESEWQRMLGNPRRPVARKDLPSTHIEIDLGRQLILLVHKGRVAHHIHTSTGKPSTPTVRGTFTVYEMRNYMQTNHMYRSIFFYGGYAMHGYPSVPTYPASHGCSRTYNGNQDFIWPKVFIGERVATY